MTETHGTENNNVIEINIEKEFWIAIKKATTDSSWIPKEYMMNDWVYDVCQYLKNRHKTNT